MSTIDSYIKQTAKKYPHTREVAEQLEEIRDTLHIKTEEFQAQGLGYDQAAQAAIDSLGDISALMSDVAGESRMVYTNRMFMHLSLISMAIVSVELVVNFLFMTLPYQLSAYIAPHSAFVDGLVQVARAINIMAIGGDIPGLFWMMLFPLLAAVWIWPIITIVNYIREPKKTGVVHMRVQKQAAIAWFGLLAASVVLFLLNFQFSSFDNSLIRISFWFVWPVIFLLNWPLIIWSYARRLKSGRYDA